MKILVLKSSGNKHGFSQMGVTEKKALIFPQIPGRGDVSKNEDYVAQIHKLAQWLHE